MRYKIKHKYKKLRVYTVSVTLTEHEGLATKKILSLKEGTLKGSPFAHTNMFVIQQ